MEIIGNRYRILSMIGRGARGTVFVVMDEKISKKWVAKRVDELDEPEIEALKSINHPAFPRIVDSLHDKDGIYLIMDYIEGKTLAEYGGGRGLDEKDRMRIAIELADALRTLHDSNPSMLYLDCKPDNIIVDSNGHIHLVDMGSIYMKDMINPGRLSGTPAYASPEQKRGEKPDKYSDVFAYGKTLSKIVDCGSRDVALKNIIARCTRNNPKERYQSMNEIINALNSERAWGRFRVGAVRGTDIALKSLIALFTILSFLYYSEYYDLLYLILGNALLLLLWQKCRNVIALNEGKWKYSDDIHMGRGAKLLGIIIASISLSVTLGSIKAYADSRYDVCLYDSEGYKTLYKGQRISVDKDKVRVYIPNRSIGISGVPVRIELYNQGAK